MDSKHKSTTNFVIFKYMRLQKITALFRFIEMFLFLVMISRCSSQLPFAVKVPSYYFKGISLTMLNPKFVFVIGNMIILILFLKSRSLEKDENDDACYEYVKKCDMNVVNCSSVVAYKPKISRSRSSDNRIRVKSKDDQTCKELRRSVTDISKSTTMAEKRIVKEELSSDDFRRTVEDFIARQQKILRDEEFSPMVYIGP